jgi:hypothetical protein
VRSLEPAAWVPQGVTVPCGVLVPVRLGLRGLILPPGPLDRVAVEDSDAVAASEQLVSSLKLSAAPGCESAVAPRSGPARGAGLALTSQRQDDAEVPS